MTTQPTLTVAEDAIANADAYTSNAVLPTYSELLAALKDAQAALDHLAVQARGTGYAQMASLRAHASRTLLERHARTMRGEFGPV